MANLDFKSDLKLGNEGELFVVSFLESKGCEFIHSNNDNKYDIKMFTNGKEITYEIKTDVTCAPLFDTGNLFVEFSYRKRPSGILTTNADWFVTYFKYLNQIWFIKTNNLLDLIQNNDFKVFKNAGDLNSETHGYLINRENFKNYFQVYSC